ncbi:arginine--tRNA ligase [Candidatus Deianiraea vastatrix]|uniref:Arginine--tRNA ligase n=1 Tax=Candidatus Deianiraea vastatrix TaxID=2163644 RepID=A0A5B8XD19_9RICK|nr:arginine--tRNA ligase [Candidatus Deianiraea vastatrix]QED23222.1 Arginine--tRNA ligase [Candidatus Deianiraea vastatrix]
MTCVFQNLKQIIDKICLEKTSVKEEIIAKCDASYVSPKFADKFDISANHAMIIASNMRENPNQIAENIIENLKKHEFSENIADIQNISGFINIKMQDKFWQKIALSVMKDQNYGFENIGKGEIVNVEYVSANPTGPMHIGHARGAVYGDIIANLLQKCGFSVIREYYINDAGAQIDKVISSVQFRIKQVINNDFSENLPDKCYPGEYVIDCAKAAIEKFGKDAQNADLRKFIIDYMMSLIKEDLAKLGVYHSVFTSEQAITDANLVEKAVSVLKEKGLIYTGILEKPKHDSNKEWEDREQLLFASSKFGDESDRAIQKSDGSWAYFTPDIAYHFDKFNRGARKMILVLGADHKGYKKRICAAVSAISDSLASVDVKLCELVNFVKNGAPVKMSKRAGNFLTLSDVLDEIDPQILRFFLITKKCDTVVDFDFEKVLEQSKENPIFYIQYANSRCNSLIAKAKTEGFDMPSDFEAFARLINHPKQIEILAKIGQFPRLISHCAKNAEPHLVATYLIDLVGAFHSLWNIADFRFIDKNNQDQTKANLVFIACVQQIIKSCLDLFGVRVMEKM